MPKKSIILVIVFGLIGLLLLAIIAALATYILLQQTSTTTKYVTTTINKPYKTITKDNQELEKGQTRVDQKGVNGTVVFTFKLCFKGSKLTSKKQVKEKIVKIPVDEIVSAGTMEVTQTPSTPYPSTSEDFIRAYYEAINSKDYETAWSYLTDKQKATYSVTNPPPDMAAYTGFERFTHAYGDYVSSVSVTSMDHNPANLSLGSGTTDYWSVSLDATYIKPLPAGTHKLPTAHILAFVDGKWYINEIGTGF